MTTSPSSSFRGRAAVPATPAAPPAPASAPTPLRSRLLCRAAWLLVLACLLVLGAGRAHALTATPTTTEGPYYTMSSANQVVNSSSSYYAAHLFTTEGTDNDLTHIYSTSAQCTGSVYLLSGTLVNTSGAAISGASIELWEADNKGIYWYYSSSSGTNNFANRDQLFQGFGKTTTDSTGAWSFRTVKPGLYTGRIRHFHFKVKVGGTTLLTSQFMFSEDSASFSGDNVAQPLVQAGTISLVTLTTTTGTDTSGNSVLMGSKQIVVNYSGSTATTPTITTQPASQTVAAGGSATFSVVASSTTAMTYQWYKGAAGSGAAINGATASTYTLTNATASSAGTYYVVVANSAGSTTSGAATLTVGSTATAPTITTQPASQTVTAGASATFSVSAAGSGTLAYQWSKDGTALSGATVASYTVANATSADAGSYTVRVSNPAGAVTSSAATLTVNAVLVAPAITTQPSSQSVTAGNPVTFSVAASGSPTLTYQWYHGYTPVVGATGASFTIASATADDAGSYDVVVSNGAGSVTSDTATLTVVAAVTAPTITTQPAGQEVAAGASVTFTVAATGGGTLVYQWYKDSVAIAGATGSSYTISPVTESHAGSYYVVVSNGAGAVTSDAALLIVSAAASAPAITSQPVSQRARIGTNVTFSVTVTGSAPMIYQWYRNDVAIPGATASAYTVKATKLSSGAYNVVATNNVGSATSNKATLWVQPGTKVWVRAAGEAQAKAGGAQGKLVFVREGDDLSEPLTIRVKVKGDAEAGTDYVETGKTGLDEMLTFPAGAATLKVKIAGQADGVATGEVKTVAVKLLSSMDGSYTVDENASKAKLFVVDAK